MRPLPARPADAGAPAAKSHHITTALGRWTSPAVCGCCTTGKAGSWSRPVPSPRRCQGAREGSARADLLILTGDNITRKDFFRLIATETAEAGRETKAWHSVARRRRT